MCAPGIGVRLIASVAVFGGAEAGGAAGEVPGSAVTAPQPRRCRAGGAVEAALNDFDEDKVGKHHAGQGGEETARQRAEAERVRKRGGRQQRADGHDTERGQGERQAGVAAEERDAAGADGVGGSRWLTT